MTWLMVGRNEKGVKAGDATMNWLRPFPKRINENVVCASPAASDKPTSPSMPMVCAIHMGDSPGLRRPCAVYPWGHEGIIEVKNRLSRQCCNILSFLAGHTCSGRLLWLGDFGQREHGGRLCRA